MAKAPKSAGRKTSHCLRRQGGGQTDMEELNLDTQHPPQGQPKGGDQIVIQNTSSAGILSESWDHKETPLEAEEKSDAAAHPQAKSLWKPIPPLLPEPHSSTTSETRDQSCQTEEQVQPTAANSHGHNTGVSFDSGHLAALIHSPSG
ncbi:hypothetical protein XENOCAPTIV_003399 [Xenoophorus captivus]|uniref:Prolactin receptor n=1 Tax=Xenoophorus captivus TaxID=1517983 RepID=A0ABV0SA47_9TELE